MDYLLPTKSSQVQLLYFGEYSGIFSTD